MSDSIWTNGSEFPEENGTVPPSRGWVSLTDMSSWIPLEKVEIFVVNLSGIADEVGGVGINNRGARGQWRSSLGLVVVVVRHPSKLKDYKDKEKKRQIEGEKSTVESPHCSLRVTPSALLGRFIFDLERIDHKDLDLVMQC